MKAAIIQAPGEMAIFDDFPDPIPSEGREVVDLVAAGIHPIVRSLAAGRHYGSSGQWPMVPGVDAVVRYGDGTFAYSGFPEPPYGTIAERISVPSWLRIPLPAGADPIRIAAGLNPGMASWLPIKRRREQLGKLGTVLVLGVTGMAGMLAAQNALAAGARRVVGAGRDPQGLEDAASVGATIVELRGDGDRDAAALQRALEESAPDIVLDFLWGTVAESAFAALGRRGLNEDEADIAYVQIGAAAGAQAALPAALLRSRKLQISGSGAGSGSIADVIAAVPHYMNLIAGGSVDVPVRTFALRDVALGWSASSRGRPRVVVAGE